MDSVARRPAPVAGPKDPFFGPWARAAYDALRTAAEGPGSGARRRHPMWEEYGSEPGTPPGQTRTDVYWPVTPG